MQAQLVEWRRHLHMHPELSFNEYQTSAFVKTVLDKHKISYSDGWVKTGIVATLGKKNSDACIAIRGDMDALPIQEQNICDYRSQNAGIMHACGHDVHTTCALGAAVLLKQFEDSINGKIIVVFQPGEEVLPGGASLMLNEGALGNPLPKAILGLHVFPEMEVGNLGFREGEYMASSDEIYLTVKGKGGHAAMPKQYNSPLIIASKILLALETAFSEEKTAMHTQKPTVLAFGKIEGKGATNIIPDSVEIAGTFRAMDENWRARAHEIMATIARETANASGGQAELTILKGYPALTNHVALTQFCKKEASTLWGNSQVKELEMRMTAEDFAYYGRHMPACFFRLGTRNEARGIISPVHTATFDIDENALPVGAATMAWLAVQYLNKN